MEKEKLESVNMDIFNKEFCCKIKKRNVVAVRREVTFEAGLGFFFFFFTLDRRSNYMQGGK